MIKTFGVVELIREALTPMVDGIEIAFIFGSAARAELGPASDINLLVVGDATFAEVVRVTRPAQEQLGRDVNPTVYNSEEIHRKLEAGHHFLPALVDEPRLDVIEDSSELERLGTQWADRSPDGPWSDSLQKRSAIRSAPTATCSFVEPCGSGLGERRVLRFLGAS